MALFIVLHVVKSFMWNCSVFTQYSYYRDFFCSGAALRLRDCAIVGYSSTPGEQVSAILLDITITLWLKSQVCRVTYYFVLMHDIFTSQNAETNYTVIMLSY